MTNASMGILTAAMDVNKHCSFHDVQVVSAAAAAATIHAD